MSFPRVSLRGHNGEVVDVGGQKGIVVVYFFPKAFTGGCTREALKFSELHGEFEALGVKVYGVSTDPPDVLARFAERHGLRFTLLSDEGGKLASQLGILRPTGTAERVTYVLVDGKIAHVIRGLRDAERHACEALQWVRKAVGRGED